MSAPFPFGYTVEVERGPQDEHGDIEYAYSHDIEGVAWAPRFSQESNDFRTTVIIGLTLYGPYGSDLKSEDRVVLPALPELPADREERTYRVIGERGDWRNPFTGWTPGFEVALERVS